MDSDRELHPGAEWAHVSFSSRALIAPDGEVLATIHRAVMGPDMWHVASKVYAGEENAKRAAVRAAAELGRRG